MKWSRVWVRSAIWLAFACAVVWPVPMTPSAVLIGHPDVDVWNHAWGYWFVPHALAEFSSPLVTDLVGAPDGGVLYFIDFIGALIGAPLAWLFGPAVSFNGVLMLRIAAAGLAAQVLCDEWTGRGAHGWVAGAAFASMPFLLCEMSNGISEVASVHWIAWVLWAAERVRQTGRAKDWRRLGLLLGLCAAANFYYGLVSGLMIAMVIGVDLGIAWRRNERPTPEFLRAAGTAVAIAVAVVLPFWVAFQWTLSTEGALIVRPKALSDGWMLAHNAVDPRTYLWPGDFQSVDLGSYGEAFRHTGYLRWSLVVLGIVGVVTHRRLRIWALAGLVCLLLGLGPFLWLGDWVMVGGRHVSLPFYWMQLLLPDVAITHTLRLSIGGQLVLCVLAAGGLAAMARRLTPIGSLFAAVAVTVVVSLESAFGSAAAWPVPTSDATVPAYYAQLAPGPVLDLPGSVGRTMATSRYFWYQTVHQQPIPYSPNVRLDSCRDLDVPAAFSVPRTRSTTHEVVEDPGSASDILQLRLASRYSAIVLHTDLEARASLPSAYGPVLQWVFGEPETMDTAQIWQFGVAQ